MDPYIEAHSPFVVVGAAVGGGGVGRGLVGVVFVVVFVVLTPTFAPVLQHSAAPRHRSDKRIINRMARECFNHTLA